MRGCSQALGNQHFQWVDGPRRVQVKHQPVLVGSHRREREHLRQGFLFQVNHQAHHARGVLSDPYAGNVGVVVLHLGHQFAQCRVQFDAVNVHCQARWCANEELFGCERSV